MAWGAASAASVWELLPRPPALKLALGSVPRGLQLVWG